MTGHRPEPPGARELDDLVTALIDDATRLRHGTPALDGRAVDGRRALAPQTAAVVTRLREVMAEHVRREAELEELYGAAHDLTRIRDVDHALRTVCERTKRLMRCDAAYLSDRIDEEWFAVRAWSGKLSPDFKGTRVRIGVGVGGAVAATRQPLQVEDYVQAAAIKHNDYLDHRVGAEDLHTLLGVPLEFDGRLLGLLFAARRERRLFTDAEVALMSSLAAHAAVALNNAQLFEAQKQAMAALERSTLLLQAQKAAIEASVQVHERLTQVLLRGEGAGPIAAVVGETFGMPTTILDADDVVLARHGTCPPEPPFPPPIREALDRSRGTGRPARADGPDGRLWYVGTAAAGNTVLGTVLLTADRELTDTELRTFEQVAQTVSVSRLADAAIAEADIRASAELVRRLIDPSRYSPEELDRVTRRHRLSTGPITVAVADPVRERANAQLTAATALCAEQGGLAARYDDLLVVIQPAEPTKVAALLWERLRSAAGAPATVAAAGPAASPLDLRHLHREAVQCLRLMHRLGRTSFWATTAELGIYAMLFTEGASEGLDHLIDTQIGPLLDYDSRHGTTLVQTAAAYLEAGQSPAAAAARLGIHANTVSQRITRIDRLLGAGWRESPRRLDLHIALRLQELKGDGLSAARAPETA
ncbi:GAF domain-containing protein [Thermopolyspora sp. NPDC052614]|uniref:helix-turn-helix domain-containing protein n=1 Tax=Thermopolyspora sp. NPDC052614 TaxID=3155682 RepID=UPI00342D7E8D